MRLCKVCGVQTEDSSRDWFLKFYNHLKCEHPTELEAFINSCTGLDEDLMSKFIVAENFLINSEAKEVEA